MKKDDKLLKQEEIVKKLAEQEGQLVIKRNKK